MEAFPNAKIILTVRDPKSWYRSVKDTIFKGNAESLSFPINIMGKMTGFSQLFELVRNCGRNVYNRFSGLGMYEAIEQGEEISVQYFNDWIEDVKKSVPKEKLLIYNVKEGWDPLCKFLNVPVPERDFPNSNDTEKMRQRFRERKIRAYFFVCVLPAFICFLLTMFWPF